MGGILRRRLLAWGAAGALAGCARSPRTVPPPASTPAPTPSPIVASLARLPVGRPVVIQPPGQQPVVVVRTARASAQAFSAVCPHMGCVVEMLRGDLVCPCHNSQFVPSTGKLIRGPALRSLAPVRTRVAEGGLWLA